MIDCQSYHIPTDLGMIWHECLSIIMSGDAKVYTLLNEFSCGLPNINKIEKEERRIRDKKEGKERACDIREYDYS